MASIDIRLMHDNIYFFSLAGNFTGQALIQLFRDTLDSYVFPMHVLFKPVRFIGIDPYSCLKHIDTLALVTKSLINCHVGKTNHWKRQLGD